MNKNIKILERMAMPDDLYKAKREELGLPIGTDFNTLKAELLRLEKQDKLLRAVKDGIYELTCSGYVVYDRVYLDYVDGEPVLISKHGDYAESNPYTLADHGKYWFFKKDRSE